MPCVSFTLYTLTDAFLCLEHLLTSLAILIIVYKNSFMGHINYYLLYESFSNSKLSNKISFFFFCSYCLQFHCLKVHVTLSLYDTHFFLWQTLSVAYSITISPTSCQKKPWSEKRFAKPQGMNSILSKPNLIIPFSFAIQPLSLFSSHLGVAI